MHISIVSRSWDNWKCQQISNCHLKICIENGMRLEILFKGSNGTGNLFHDCLFVVYFPDFFWVRTLLSKCLIFLEKKIPLHWWGLTLFLVISVLIDKWKSTPTPPISTLLQPPLLPSLDYSLSLIVARLIYSSTLWNIEAQVGWPTVQHLIFQHSFCL